MAVWVAECAKAFYSAAENFVSRTQEPLPSGPKEQLAVTVYWKQQSTEGHGLQASQALVGAKLAVCLGGIHLFGYFHRLSSVWRASQALNCVALGSGLPYLPAHYDLWIIGARAPPGQSLAADIAQMLASLEPVAMALVQCGKEVALFDVLLSASLGPEKAGQLEIVCTSAFYEARKHAGQEDVFPYLLGVFCCGVLEEPKECNGYKIDLEGDNTILRVSPSVVNPTGVFLLCLFKVQDSDQTVCMWASDNIKRVAA